MAEGSDGGGVKWGRGHESHARIPVWVLKSEISARAVQVYCVLATYADDTGSSFPGKERLCEVIGCSRSTLDSALKELVGVDALTVMTMKRGDGGFATNRYQLHWVQDRGSSPDKSEDPSPDVPDPQEELALKASIERTPIGVTLAEPPKIAKVDGENEPLNVLIEVCGIDPDDQQSMNWALTALNGVRSPRSKKTIRQGIVHLHWIEISRWLDQHADRPDIDELRAEAVDPVRFSRSLTNSIRTKASLYAETMDGALLTPTALLKWWMTLENIRGGDDNLSADDIRRLA